MNTQVRIDNLSKLLMLDDLNIGKFHVSFKRKEIVSDFVKKRLQDKEMQVLGMLVFNAPNIVCRKEIIELIWNGNYLVGNQALTRCIHVIRKTLVDSHESRHIRTIPGLGYMLEI